MLIFKKQESSDLIDFFVLICVFFNGGRESTLSVKLDLKESGYKQEADI
jgi:hypothetical protein